MLDQIRRLHRIVKRPHLLKLRRLFLLLSLLTLTFVVFFTIVVTVFAFIFATTIVIVFVGPRQTTRAPPRAAGRRAPSADVRPDRSRVPVRVRCRPQET